MFLFHRHSWRTPATWLTASLAIGLVIIGLAQGLRWHSHWERTAQSGVITVGIREAEGVYWLGDQGFTGLEHDLAHLVGHRLGLAVQLVAVSDPADLYRALSSGAVDMVFTGISQNLSYTDFKLGQPYLMTELGLTRPMARRAPELHDQRIGILDPSSQSDVSAELQKQYPLLNLHTAHYQNATELMTRIEMAELDMALVDERDYQTHRAFFPDQRFDSLSAHPRPIAPLFRVQPDDSLKNKVNEAIQELTDEGILARLTDQYLGHTQEFDYVGVLTFEQHLTSRLPEYREAFEAQAEATGLDWRLLAAVAYQESHWRANAVSPTGVRGLMMVTQRTAREMGISNRLDPQQSIAAGSRYLSQLHRRIPERIPEPDRTWFALAAYNVGMGHLEDARILTERLGDDPDSWLAVRSHLPKLALNEWYPQTRFGYARGHEPVIYVANIRRYYTALQRAFPILDETANNDRIDNLPVPSPPPISPF